MRGIRGKVMVAMSGGVDSSVTAKLIVDAGHEACGATMRLFSGEDEVGCSTTSDIDDARQVCDRLAIAHDVFDYHAKFQECVIDRFCDGYLSGCTPNPCIDCNTHLKFRALQERRIQQGFDYVATGHYVRREFREDTGRFALRRAVSLDKDQSYVLASITQGQLAHMLFPLGEFTKDHVRALAEESGFVTAQKSESQDICFIPDGDYVSFLTRQRGECLQPGDIVDAEGKVHGKHVGLPCYTIGQRKGIGVAASQPYYVIDKRVAENQLVIGFADELLTRTVHADRINYVAVAGFDGPMRVFAKTSYRQQPQPATVVVEGDCMQVTFDEPQRKTAPGQTVVLYDQDDYVLASGVATKNHN